MKKIDSLVMLIIFAFLFSYFKPDLIIEETTIAGGDTASHYAYAEYMKEYLIPHGRVSGWYPGAYAGFPVFVFYFFPPFMLAALLGHVIPLTVAFKIVTLLGIFSLPLTTYFAMWLMRFKFPIPIVASVFTLPFLFMEANSMWGGNIPSTLAGEFSYSISLSLSVLLIGLLYGRLEDKKFHKTWPPVILLFFVTITHVYTTIFVVICSSFFLLTRDRKRVTINLTFLFWTYLVSFLLVAFWTLPLIANIGYTTPYAPIWDIKDIKEVFPPVLYPFYIFAIFGLYTSWKHNEKRIFFITYSILTAFVLYLVAPKLGIVDIRFLPIIQLFILFISAYGFYEVTKGLKGQKLIPLILIVATIIWVNSNTTYIHSWIEWNYEGFESKPLWGAYSGVNEFLRGDVSDPRVVFEHSQIHDRAGSSRAFESLPLFSGRSTLEGVYMQSSITSPFVFLIQSEISKVASCPFPQWPCARLNSTAAARHLEMFNVGQVVVVSKEAKEALKNDANYKLAASFPPYEVYELVKNNGRYVIVPKYEPVKLDTRHFKEDFYLWFLNNEVPLVFDPKDDRKLKATNLDEVPKAIIDNNCSISEEVKNEEILIKTDCVGFPHIIRISYFPNWKVEGATKIYLVSPSFMLVYPEKENVRLYYGRTFADSLGILFSLTGLLLIILESRVRWRIDKFIKAYCKYLAAFFILGTFALSIIFVTSEDKSYRDSFALEASTALKNYVLCDEIESAGTRGECFKEVGIATNDYNLCDVKLKDTRLKDECFKEIGIATGDYNLCKSRIEDQKLRDECLNVSR